MSCTTVPLNLELVTIAEVYKIDALVDPLLKEQNFPVHETSAAASKTAAAGDGASTGTSTTTGGAAESAAAPAGGAGIKNVISKLLKPAPKVPLAAGEAPHITSLSLLVLLVPPLLYYVVDRYV